MDRLARLSQLATETPDDAGVWLDLADALLEIGAVEPAHHIVARARACEPATAQHWSSLGTLLLRLDDPVAALEALRAATVLDIEDRDAAVLFARTAIEQGVPEEAEDLLQRARCLGEDPIRAYLLARAHEAQGADAPALEAALTAIRRNAQPVYEHVVLASRVAGRLGHHDVRERLVRILRSLKPDAVGHVLELADCLAQQGHQDTATGELERIVQTAMLTPDERVDVGAHYLKFGDAARARIQLEAAVAARPTDPAARALYGQALEAGGDWSSAADAYRVAQGLDPQQPGLHRRLGTALLEIGQFAEATPVLIRAVSEEPDDTALRRLLTRALLMGGGAETQPRKEGSLSGDLSVFRIEELLEFLGIQRSTGKLRLTSKGRTGVVQIVQGKITEVRYPGSEALETLLVGRGWISTAGAQTWPAALRADEMQWAGAVVDAGLVSAQDMEAVLQARIEQGTSQMLGWADGRAQFEPEPAPEPAPRFGFGHQRILMAVLTRLDEQDRESSAPGAAQRSSSRGRQRRGRTA